VASTTAIIIPAPERVAHTSPRADDRARDDVRVFGAARPSSGATAGGRPSDTQASHLSFDLSRLPRTTFGEPRGSLAFLAQQLAQNDPATETPKVTDVAPALRASALRAYGATNDSNIEFLSPTPFYDVRV
jgi:hypothetical protein